MNRNQKTLRTLSALLLTLLLVGMLGVTAMAESEASANVTVTIADEGTLVMTQETVSVTDVDGDGALTVNDALYAAHEAAYEGGAAAGYGSGMTEYGLSLNKLWGDESGSFGYRVNNVSCWSLADPVAEGDHVVAFVYKDQTAWSDSYSFFDVTEAAVKEGDTLTLTLSAAAYDAEFNPITVPVEDAVITVNGVATEYKTDAQGTVTLTLDESGTLVISATSDSQILVPAVCVAEVEAAASVGWIVGAVIAVAVVAAVVVCCVVSKRKK